MLLSAPLTIHGAIDGGVVDPSQGLLLVLRRASWTTIESIITEQNTMLVIRIIGRRDFKGACIYA